ncbi:MAG: GGDEF domain-containing protein, partial [Candidatus Omnitrophota bacterium]|nr:GGDEF domain-containing protein [Candidatus Omnitrophota bacterium]
ALRVFDSNGYRLKIKVSIGIASFPDDCADNDTGETFLDMADNVLLAAKEEGGNRIKTASRVEKSQ